MSVLSIEETIVDGNHVTVTALVDEMLLIHKATYLEPDEWAPALCSVSFELDEDESIPIDEDSFCSYLDQRDLLWQLVDTSDWDLDS
jgi:RecB family endonuclease NucS